MPMHADADMQKTPNGNRVQIGIFGRTNTGKSSFLNRLTGQQVSIESPVPGTTTDVVKKAMELLPLGPVLLLDTAGIDDTSELGQARGERTDKAFERVDICLLITEPGEWTPHEDRIALRCRENRIPLIVLINKLDLNDPSPAYLEELHRHTRWVLRASCKGSSSEEWQTFMQKFRKTLVEACPEEWLHTPPLLADLVPRGGLTVLVVPVDLQAPKGRLILPQVQSIRDALDHDSMTLVVKDSEYAHALACLKNPPDLVVCDSQAVLKVAEETPSQVKFTTFSTLFARAKGDLSAFARGAAAIDSLRSGDRVLIAEGCTHHALEDDIGRVKIPRWLRQYVGAELVIDVVSGHDFPLNLKSYRLIIHCGSCTLGRREVLGRVQEASAAGVPITNYGVAISYLQGLASRVLAPFPAALEALEKEEASV